MTFSEADRRAEPEESVVIDEQAFWRDGFYFPTRVLPLEAAGAARRELESLLARWSGDPSLPRPLNDYCRANFHIVTRWGAEIAKHAAVLDAVEQIIGPDILCWMVEVIIKEPGSGKVISMHQDFTYWGMKDQDKAVTAWLALTDATPENGCMRFVRASQLKGQVAHQDTFAADNLLSRGQEVTVDYDAKDVVACGLEAGELSLHHSLMFHGSGPNRTDDRRIGIVMRYLSPEMRPSQRGRDFALLVRGRNRTGNFACLPEPADEFTPESLALHDAITKAQTAHFAEGAALTLRYVEQEAAR